MTDQPLGIGLIGCGDIAPAHAKALAAATGAKLVVCMDVAEASASSLAAEFGIPYTTKLDELLARPEVEAVIVATPAFTHAEIVERAARAGKAVICEKPIAPDLAQADRLIGACARARVPLATCFPLRYLAGAKWTRELIAAGALGEIIAVRLSGLSEKQESYWTGGYSGRSPTEWRKSKTSSGGGVMITNLIHNIDLARALTGLEVTRAFGEAGTFCTNVEVEDLAFATLRYQNGAIGLVQASSCFFGRYDDWDVVIVGRMGQARFDFWGNRAEAFLTEPAAGLPAREWVKRERESSSLVEFHNDYAAAVRSGKTPPVTGEDGRKALEVVVAIYRSAETNRPVKLGSRT